MSGACPAIPRLPPTGTSYNPGMPPLPEYCCAVISDPRGWLVLQLRPALSAHAADQLTCFGGRREEGEDALSCLMRELDEELGWRPHSATACCELWKGARLVARFYRVLPVVAALSRQTAVPISLDTCSPPVARACLDTGVEAINDITALADPAMLALAAASRCGVCAMHMRGAPPSMQNDPQYGDVVAEVLAWLAARRDALTAQGIAAQRIALDPGIGFGKTAAHNLAILNHLARYRELGCPLLVGLSRKAFIGQALGNPSLDRTAGTIGAALAAARQGVEILRVHDVAAVRQALLLFAAAGGMQ